MLSRTFSGCPWRSATATTNASGTARRSRRVAVGLRTTAGAGMALPHASSKMAFDLGISLELITAFVKEVGVKYSLLTTLIYTAQTGTILIFLFIFFPFWKWRKFVKP